MSEDIETAGEYSDGATTATTKEGEDSGASAQPEIPTAVEATANVNNVFAPPPPPPPVDVKTAPVIASVEKIKTVGEPVKTAREEREQLGQIDQTAVLSAISAKVHSHPPKIQRKGIDVMQRYSRQLRVGPPEKSGCANCIKTRKTKIFLYCIFAFFIGPIISPFIFVGSALVLLFYTLCCQCRRQKDAMLIGFFCLLFSSFTALALAQICVGVKFWGQWTVSMVEVLAPVAIYAVLVTCFVIAVQQYKGADRMYQLEKKTRAERKYSDSDEESGGSYSEGTQLRLTQAVKNASDTLVSIMDARCKWSWQKHAVWSVMFPLLLAFLQALICPLTREAYGLQFVPRLQWYDKFLGWNGFYCMLCGTYLLVLFLSITVQSFLHEDSMQEEFANLTSDQSLVQLDSSEGEEQFILKIKDSYHLTLWTSVRYRLQHSIGEACQSAACFVAMSLSAITIFVILMLLRFLTNSFLNKFDEFAMMSFYDTIVLAGFLFILLNAAVSLSKVPKQDMNFLIQAKRELLQYAQDNQKKGDRSDAQETSQYIQSLVDVIKLEGPPTVLGIPLTYMLRNIIIAIAVVMLITGLYLGARSSSQVAGVYSLVKSEGGNVVAAGGQYVGGLGG